MNDDLRTTDVEYSFQESQRAMLNILEDSDAEKKRLETMQTAILNILEDFSDERTRFVQMQTATLNILEDFDAEKKRLEQSQRAFLNILEDIDLEKGKLSQANRRIESANVELEEFAYVASHDLKAPLRVIDNASKWLEEDLKAHLTDEPRENMALLRSRVRRMEKLLDDLLEYSRIGRSVDERYVHNVRGDVLVRDILSLLSPPDGCSISVSPQFADVYVCQMPLQQILMNLIGNAIKHHDKKIANIDLGVESNDSAYVFTVKDDGPGIPAQFHEQVFKMFQTLKPRDQVEGSGMGLTMVRKNVERFGGSIMLESAEGQGATFRFTWPKRQTLTGQTHVSPPRNA